MKKLLLFVLIVSTSYVHASEYLSAKDQEFYRNDPTDGNNKRERIDSAVIEINKIYREMKSMKEEMAKMRKELDEVKAKK